MPFNFKLIDTGKAINLKSSASHLELYLIGKAFNSFSKDRVAGDYYMLDQYTGVEEMPGVCNALNEQLEKFGLPTVFHNLKTFEDLIKKLRNLFETNSKRAYLLDWLIGNENEEFMEIAEKENVWKLPYNDLLEFCKDLSKNHRK